MQRALTDRRCGGHDRRAAHDYNAICWNHEAGAKAFLDRATPLVRARDDPYLWMLLQGNAGLVELLRANPSAAEHAFSEQLRLCRELVVRPTAAEGSSG